MISGSDGFRPVRFCIEVLDKGAEEKTHRKEQGE